MNLGRVQAFVRVAELKSFTEAARSLDLPTSSISRAITALETELGAKLFERTTRRLALTPLGRTYYEHASRALAELSEGERRIGELQRDPRGEVRITAPGDLDDGFLARCLSEFAALHPRIRVTTVLTNRFVDLIGEGIDLALRVAEGLPDSSLVARPLGRYRAFLVASPEYEERRGLPERPEDLSRHECILTVASEGGSRWVLIGPKGEEAVEVKGRLVADDLRFVRDLVDRRRGDRGARPGARREGARRRAPRAGPASLHPPKAPTLFAVVPSTKRLASRVSVLRDFLVSAYAAA
jgi:DNA-binding transcriptional LysR family regulator